MIPYTPPGPAQHIPVIDLDGGTFDDPGVRAAIAWEIHKASRECGFFYLANHGIDQSLIDQAFTESKHFFTLPLARKLAISVKNWPCLRGYDPMQAQTLDAGSPPDHKEAFYLGCDLGPDHAYVKRGVFNYGANQWPDELPRFRNRLEAYFDEIVDFGRRLMRLLALSLDLDESYFDDGYREPSAILRVHRYPPRPPDATPNLLGAGAHTDFGSITILVQDDCPGLEVQNAAGQWLRADPIRGTLLVNNGDMIKRWTNNLYHSNMHRVLNLATDRDRYSMALFFNPDYFTHVDCVPSCRPSVGEPGYRPCTAGDHVAERLRQSYGQDVTI